MTIDLVQGSLEWKLARAGKVTASRVGDATARSKKSGDWLAARANYMAELTIERLTGAPFEQYVSTAMEWGTLQEPEARRLYALMTDAEITEVGFVPHPRIVMAGGSPDGLVGAHGLVQIKCPNTATHIDMMRRAVIDLSYIKQMQFEMACTGRQWCDFVSFDPRLEGSEIFIKRIGRDDKMIGQLEEQIVVFLAELDKQVEQIRTMGCVILMEDAA